QPARLRPPLAGLLWRPQTFAGRGRRHADVDERDVRLVHPDVTQEVFRRAALRDDLEPGVLEQPRDPLAQQHGIVCEDYAHAAEASAGRAERGKARRESGGVELEEPFRRVDPGQLVVAEIPEVVRRLQLLARARGEQDLPTAACLADA